MISTAGPTARSPSIRELIQRPLFIVSTPRSGSTLLFETLEQAPGLYSTGRESHWRIEDIPGLSPAKRGWSSNRLMAEDAKPERIEQLARAFYNDLRDRGGHAPNGPVRMLEKTPKNALRVPFFDAAFPDAIFVYLYRDVRQTLASMMEAWTSGGFQTYPGLPGWSGYVWSLLLIPGWHHLIGEPLPVVVAHQWATTTNILLDDLARISAERLRVMTHEQFLAAPQSSVERLASSLELQWDRQLGANLPLSKTTVSQPRPDKWRQFEREIEPAMQIVAEADARARAFVEQHSIF
jgi:hypothetical protein